MQKVGARKKFTSNCSSEIRGERLESIEYPPLQTPMETGDSITTTKADVWGGKGNGGGSVDLEEQKD